MLTRRALSPLAILFVAACAAYAAVPSPAQRADARRFASKAAASAPVLRRPSAADYKAFAEFRKKTSAAWTIRYNPRTGAPAALSGGANARYAGAAPEAAALRFFADNAALLKVDPAQLQITNRKTALGITHILYTQTISGVPVENGTVKIHIDADGSVISFQSNFTPGVSTVPVAAVTMDAAARAAAQDAGGRAGKGALVLWPSQDDAQLRLAWKIPVTAGGATPGSWHYYVDAVTGGVITRVSRLNFATAGTVTGAVYPIAPQADTLAAWAAVSTVPLHNQYVWVRNYQNRVVTDEGGVYSSATDGKIFASLKGPYFSMINFRGASADYNNGGGTWLQAATPAHSPNFPNPYPGNQVMESTVPVPNSCAYFAKAAPHFTRLEVGVMGLDGTITNPDELYVLNPATGRKEAAYIGARTSGFFGAPVENPSYVLRLESGQYQDTDQLHGYNVDYSTYMCLTASPGTPDPPTSSFTWNWRNASDNSLDETNAFYHLNAIRDFFTGTVDSPLPLSGSRMVDMEYSLPVMLHAHGSPDGSEDEMVNAFFDTERKNMMFGDGIFVAAIQKRHTFSLDATIIRHEYTHSVVDRIYPLINIGESGAISEAMADYWSLSSLYGSPGFTSVVGAFVAASSGEGIARDLGQCAGGLHCVYPTDWVSEVHDDSMILSRALWDMRDPSHSNYYMGTNSYSALGINTPVPRSDVYIFNSLLFFPDNFYEFREDMETVCRKFEERNLASGGYENCSSDGWLAKMQSAFAAHGISQPRSGADIYEPDDGPEQAVDISSQTAQLSATISPAYDEDFYSLPLPAGPVSITLNLPRASVLNTYHVLEVSLFDGAHKFIGSIWPDIINPDVNTCPAGGECLTDKPSVTLSATLAKAGRYYLTVWAGPNAYFSPCADYSANPYTLRLNTAMSASASASVITAAYDGDTIHFDVPYNRFNYAAAPPWLSTMTAQVELLDYAQLRDQKMVPLEEAVTRPGGYLQLGTVSTGYTMISGSVQLKSGFGQRYPTVGAVYLELFGQVRFTNVVTGVAVSTRGVSLGISQVLTLAAASGGITVWNNIFNPDKGGFAEVRYDAAVSRQLSLQIFSPDGTLVRTLFNGLVPAGKGALNWNGANMNGIIVAPGMYILRAKGAGIDALRKIVVIR
ncbi:MAG: hypothetical protein PHP45_01480 [Elusimicrobiales bacterium]|nr:hypothetical protein [Elusimicrobiales bacterium]